VGQPEVLNGFGRGVFPPLRFYADLVQPLARGTARAPVADEIRSLRERTGWKVKSVCHKALLVIGTLVESTGVNRSVWQTARAITAGMRWDGFA